MELLAPSPPEPGRPRISARRIPDPWRIALAALALGLWLASVRDHGPEGYFLPLKGLAVVFLGLAPGLSYLARARRAARDGTAVEPIPYLPIFGLVFAIYYGLPPLVRDRVTFMSLSPTATEVDEALDLAFLGLAALYAGFAWIGPSLPGGRGRPIQVAWDGKRARAAATVLIAVGAVATIAADALVIPGSLAQVVRLLGLFLRVGVGILLVLDLRGSTTRATSPS